MLSAGGFSKNKEMMKSFQPNVAGSCTATYQMGEGILMGQALGAKLGNMWCPQVDLMGVQLGEGDMRCLNVAHLFRRMFTVGIDGKRHFREDLYYEQGSWEVAKLEGGYGWAIWDQEETDLGQSAGMPWMSAGYEDEIAAGYIYKADTIEELADQIGLEGEARDNLVETFNNYQGYCDTGVDLELGRERGLDKLVPPLYACKEEPAILDTAGGLCVVPETEQVVDVWDEPIEGLYVAGMMVSGYRGKMYNGGGASVSSVITFGRIAGRSVATAEPDGADDELVRAEGIAQIEFVERAQKIEGELHDGQFVGSGSGIGGVINVTIEVSDGCIAVTDISPNNETQGVGGYEAIEDGTYAAMVEEAQSAEIDGITGASITTDAIRNAVQMAINASIEG